MPTAVSDVELLARLVAFDTTSHRSNLEMAGFLADYLARPGVRVAENRSPDGEKTNLVVTIGPEPDEGGGDGGSGDAPSGLGGGGGGGRGRESGADGGGRRPGLVLSGHMDVVPATEDGWQSDPFTLTDRGDTLAARGAADMKGFLALATNLAREVDPGGLTAPLVLVLTYDEEVGTLGARHLVESWQGPPFPTAAIIGEPTELAVVGRHKGHLKLRVSLEGVSAHSGYPHLGVNAIEAGGRVIAALAGLRRELEGERPAGGEAFGEVPFVALNVGTVAGGSAINVVPDRCSVEIGVRLLPRMESGPLVARVEGAVAAAAGMPHRLEVLSDSPPMALADDAPVARALLSLSGGGRVRTSSAKAAGTEAAAGRSADRPRLAAVSFATDAGWLQRMGLECAIWGPGSIEVAHKPNEAVPKADLVAARRVLERVVAHFCGGGGGGAAAGAE